MTVLPIWKPVGQSPLQTLNALRLSRPELANEKLAYAGRLDPMAEGVLLVLVGDKCKKRKDYENLDKVYEFSVLVGISTDTYDLMGRITDTDVSKEPSSEQTNEFIKTYSGTFPQTYPPFSSVRVNGKALYYWARAGKLDTLEIPSKSVTISAWEQMASQSISVDELKAYVDKTIGSVVGEFRQPEILADWELHLSKLKQSLQLVRFRIHCSSGTYVRSLTNAFSRLSGVPMTTFTIRRTAVGKFLLPIARQ